MQFHALRVSEIREETADTRTIVFEIPDEIKSVFQFKPGQYLTLRLEIGGEEQRRSYSMSSSPLSGELAITVKKVVDGKVSTFLTEQLSVGDSIECAPPEGRFFVEFDAEKRRTLYLIGAGSGITPLMSLAKTALELEPASPVHLLYGSRNEESIIFKNELDRLATRYADQFLVEHTLSQPKREKGGGIGGFFGRSTLAWQGKTGRIEPKLVRLWLAENPAATEQSVFFLCGPGTMMESIKTALIGQGILPKSIHTEHFISTPPKAEGQPGPISGGPARLVASLRGEQIEVEIAPGQTLLDALIKAKHDPPYSCTAGACSTCMARLKSGKVKMDACFALDDDEVKDGWILTCQSHPETDLVEISYEN